MLATKFAMLCARDIQCRRAAPRLQKIPLNAGRKALNRQAVSLIVQYLLSLIDECHIHSMSICETVHDIIINQTQIKKAINRLFPQCGESCEERMSSFSLSMSVTAVFIAANLQLFLGMTAAVKNIEIITSLPYNLGIAPDIRITGAAYELAAESVMRWYGNASMHVSPVDVRLRYLFDANNSYDVRTCDDIAKRSAQRLSEYYYTRTVSDTCYAMVSSRKYHLYEKRLNY